MNGNLQLTKEGADRRGDLDTEILVGGEGAVGSVDVPEHGGGDGDGEDVVCVGEETDAGDEAGADVVPARVIDKE